MPVERISEHVLWLPPGPPDRPSLCAVVGARWTLALDAGSSRTHTREFLAGLPEPPAAVVYTHAHWDHVFGGVEIDGLVIAHSLTARRLDELAVVDWNDEANVSDTVRQELPAPRVVEIAPADVVFAERIELDLGGVGVTVERALPLYDRILSYPAERCVEGHHPSVTTRAEVEELIEKARAAARGDATPDDEDAQYFLNAFVH